MHLMRRASGGVLSSRTISCFSSKMFIWPNQIVLPWRKRLLFCSFANAEFSAVFSVPSALGRVRPPAPASRGGWAVARAPTLPTGGAGEGAGAGGVTTAAGGGTVTTGLLRDAAAPGSTPVLAAPSWHLPKISAPAEFPTGSPAPAASWHRAEGTMRRAPSRLMFPLRDGKQGGSHHGGAEGGRGDGGVARGALCKQDKGRGGLEGRGAMAVPIVPRDSQAGGTWGQAKSQPRGRFKLDPLQLDPTPPSAPSVTPTSQPRGPSGCAAAGWPCRHGAALRDGTVRASPAPPSLSPLTMGAAVSRHFPPSPFIPSRSPPFPSPLPGRQIKAWTCESRGTKATHKGGRPRAALLAARPEQGDGDLAPSPGLSRSHCPLLSPLSTPPWGPGAAVGNASGKRGVPWGQDDVPGAGVRIWSG